MTGSGDETSQLQGYMWGAFYVGRGEYEGSGMTGAGLRVEGVL